MKKLWPFVASCVACMVLCGSAFAQDITGTYQGTIALGKGLRIVLKIAKSDDGKGFKTTLYSIDQPQAPPLPAKTTTLTGGTLKIDIPQMGGSYEGKVSPDFQTITGTLNQGAGMPLNLVKATDATAWVIPEPPAKIPPMDKNANPSFDVATIKPSAPDAKGFAFLVDGSKLTTRNTTLEFMIEFAYSVQSKQIVGAPAWVAESKFDVVGTPDTPGTPNAAQLRAMLQKLLADRFKLKFHNDKKELSVYALEPGKAAPKLEKSDSDQQLPGLGFAVNNGVTLNAVNAKLADFTDLLQSNVVDRPVLDKTGVEGRYNFKISFTPDDSMMNGLALKLPPTPEGKEAPPNLFTAVQDQLGLKLEAVKAQTPVLIVDHVEKPSDN